MRGVSEQIDPTVVFKIYAAGLAAVFRGIAKREDVLPVREALDLIAAADSIDKALKHLRPGALDRD